MKTKHLVAMALPLAFTACSQEELINENNQATTSERKVVENVVFKFNAEADSRMHFDEEYKWDAGDKFGACLMDQFRTAMTGDFTWEKWFNQFELVDYLHTNYPFTRDENGSWTNTEAVMQEGNYFFYYPYNNNLGGQRTPIQLNVPTDQIVKDGQKTSSVLDYQMFVAYAPVVADPSKGNHETITNLTMEPLLAYPAFNITNNTGNPFTITRIALGGVDGFKSLEFPTIFEVKPSSGKFNGLEFVTGDKTEEEKREAVIKIVEASEENTVSKVTLQFGEKGKALNNSESFTSYVMLPTPNMLGNKDEKIDKLYLYIYTDKGLVTVDLSTEDRDDMNDDDIKLQNALTSYKFNDGSISYITLDERAFKTPGKMQVSSTSDLTDFVVWNKNTRNTIKAEVLGDITISKDVYDVLAQNKNLHLELSGNGKVTIPNDAPKEAIDLISLNSSNLSIVNNADLTISKDIKGGFASIENNANMTWVSSSYSGELFSNNVNIINNGTIVLNKKGMKIDLSSLEFKNYGEVIVKSNAEIIYTSEYFKYGKFENEGKLTINENVSLTGVFNNTFNKETVKYGTIEVNGVFEAKGTNEGYIIVGENGSFKATGFTNNDKIVYAPNKSHEPKVLNSGVVNGIINNGIIEISNENARLQSDPNSNGRIDNTKLSPYVQKATNETIFVEIVEDKNATEIARIVKASNAKELRIKGNVTIDPEEGKNTVTIKGEEEELNVIAIGDLNFIGKQNTMISFIANQGEWLQNSPAKFTVENGTVTKVVSGITVDFGKGKVEGTGKILIQSGAEFICGVDKPANAEVYGKWTNSNK